MERDRLREELVQWMETTPIIVAPVGATPAYPHDTLKVTVRGATFGTFRAFSYAQTFSVFNLPVVTVPAGKSNEGLPIGVQIAGTPFAEEMILAAAEIVEAALSSCRFRYIICATCNLGNRIGVDNGTSCYTSGLYVLRVYRASCCW